jgi:hypothetical protein
MISFLHEGLGEGDQARTRSSRVGFVAPCALAMAFAAALVGCGGSPTAPARDDVFYLHGGGVIDRNESWELYFPPLNAEATQRVPKLVGVGILRGDVRLSRPMDWSIRAADYTPQQRFISYQSPRQFIFSIYERIDPTEDTWPDVLKRYEQNVDDQGSDILSARLPIATANTQGREYVVKTRVPAKPDYQSYSHEVLIRGDHRILLVQIVHGDDIEASADEMAAALKSLIVY